MEVDINIYTPPPPKKKGLLSVVFSIKHKFWRVKVARRLLRTLNICRGGDSGFLERGLMRIKMCVCVWGGGVALLIVSYFS